MNSPWHRHSLARGCAQAAAAIAWNEARRARPSVADILAELAHVIRSERASGPYYARFAGVARRLDVATIRAERDVAACARLDAILRSSEVRYQSRGIGRLGRVFSRAELGELATEARNRVTVLSLGRVAPREHGPRFDLERIPLERLEALIQSHADLNLVDRMRAERNRRLAEREARP